MDRNSDDCMQSGFRGMGEDQEFGFSYLNLVLLEI